MKSVIITGANRGIGLDNYGNPSDTTCVEVTSFSDFACTPISEVGTDQLIGSFLPEEKISNLYDGSEVNGIWQINWIIKEKLLQLHLTELKRMH